MGHADKVKHLYIGGSYGNGGGREMPGFGSPGYYRKYGQHDQVRLRRHTAPSHTDFHDRLWDLAAGKAMTTLTHHKKSVRALAIAPHEYTFASASSGGNK